MTMEAATTDPPVILLDFDGVIADSFEAYFGAFTTVCAEMGYARLNSREAFLKLFEGNALRQLFWQGFPVFRLKRLVRLFAPRIVEAHQRVRPFAGMPEVVCDLASRYPLYVVTSNASSVVSAFLARHGMEGVRGVLGLDKEKSKVKKIRRVMNQHPGRPAFFAGDTKGDLRDAHNAGAVSVGVAWGWHSVAKLQEAKPAHIVRTPEKLRDLFVGP